MPPNPGKGLLLSPDTHVWPVRKPDPSWCMFFLDENGRSIHDETYEIHWMLERAIS